MPCSSEGYAEYYESQAYSEAQLATRAACDLAEIVRRDHRLQEASKETQIWVHKHLAEDAIRLKKEAEQKAQLELRLRALAKLDQDERRALGL